MADYKLIKDKEDILTGIKRSSDGAIIPVFSGNSDYKVYLEWALTETADPADIAYENTWEYVRSLRDIKLATCDWTQTVDSPLASGILVEFQTYRQDLRDVPQDFATPQEVVWPTEPSL